MTHAEEGFCERRSNPKEEGGDTSEGQLHDQEGRPQKKKIKDTSVTLASTHTSRGYSSKNTTNKSEHPKEEKREKQERESVSPPSPCKCRFADCRNLQILRESVKQFRSLRRGIELRNLDESFHFLQKISFSHMMLLNSPRLSQKILSLILFFLFY